MVPQTREGQLLETFVTLADTLVADYDVVDLLCTLVDKCAALLEAAAAGIILSAGDGQLEVVASTNERSRLVELLQLRAGSGPCVESFLTGRAVAVPDIDTVGEVWPRFRAGALEQGFASMHAVPLRLRATTIGSLNLFWERTGGLSEADINTVQALADVATIGILQERAIRESDIVRQQLQRALNSRVLIEQAKGVLAYTHDVHMGDAFDLIRDYARKNGIPLADVAEQIVNRALSL
ncbi:transcriptional regulator [Cryobacterium roopkundense]|uniref:GAF domain-containing protein n=1 Tax=Cryobacterium roopkundense TaxID=1001240 RepID=A0A099JC94_9MICO|nr:GAF and ANTAR domain-containing protein [Cryobacterium roopkundense]KGJ75695.1 transcriptional regulator [Cryobacterium roopkundense]MBB5641149.1 GAF domain-containing protein [Cryobacterium roopkundense]